MFKKSFNHFIRNCIGLPMLAFMGTISVAHADSEGIVVSVDRARIVKVADGTQTLIIGNPAIADVTMLKGNGSMVISGRAFGTTNVILLDSTGAQIDETTITVVATEKSLVLMRGASQESYSCTPQCAPTITMGDDTGFMNNTITNSRTRNSALLGGTK